MKDDSLHQPLADTPDPDQEIWLSRDEVLELFPVTERQLKYWRDTDKIEFETRRKRSFYLESSVREQVERSKAQKKSWTLRDVLELRTIDPPIAIIIVAVGYFFLDDFSFADPLLVSVIKKWPSIELLIIALGWYFVRWIKYIYKRRLKSKDK